MVQLSPYHVTECVLCVYWQSNIQHSCEKMQLTGFLFCKVVQKRNAGRLEAEKCSTLFIDR